MTFVPLLNFLIVLPRIFAYLKVLFIVYFVVWNVTFLWYPQVGGSKEQIVKLREVVETPLLHPERFVNLGIDPPKGVLLYGPPGTGKTLCARAVANRTDACFIRVIGSELVQKYVGEGARMVRELFEMARSKKGTYLAIPLSQHSCIHLANSSLLLIIIAFLIACLIFFDEIDAVGGARHDDGQGGDNEVQRTMLELINQLDGFDARGNIKVLMATNRPDTLDPALLRPGRLDRKIEFGPPDLEGRAHIFKIHARSMSTLVPFALRCYAVCCHSSNHLPYLLANVTFALSCLLGCAPMLLAPISDPSALKRVCLRFVHGEKSRLRKIILMPSTKLSRASRNFQQLPVT